MTAGSLVEDACASCCVFGPLMVFGAVEIEGHQCVGQGVVGVAYVGGSEVARGQVTQISILVRIIEVNSAGDGSLWCGAGGIGHVEEDLGCITLVLSCSFEECV